MHAPALPEEGFVRLSQIIGDLNADPPRPGLIPIGSSSWWEGVKSGRYPPSVKLSPRITAWRVEDIRALIKRLGREAEDAAKHAGENADPGQARPPDMAASHFPQNETRAAVDAAIEFNPESDRIVTAKSGRPRGFIVWKPRAASQKLLHQIDAVLAEYIDHLPLTARQIFYRLVGAYDFPKLEKDYKRLQEALVRARRAQIVPFDHIRDDGIQRSNPPGFEDEESLREAIKQTIEQGVINPQEFQPLKQIVLCEAAGMLPQLARVVNEFGVEVVSSGGFNSLTAKHDLASLIAAEDKPVIVQHIGDFDPSGVHVYQSLADDVSAFVDELGGEVSFRRLAVTPIHISNLSLTTAPAKATDNRSFDGQGTVQAEAIPPNELARILKDALASNFDFGAHEEARAESDKAAARLRAEFGFDQS